VKVGSGSITQAEFMETFNDRQAIYAKTRGANSSVFFDPPEYRVCSRDERRSSAGGMDATKAELRQRCRARHERFKTETLDSVVRLEWLEQEAAARDVKVPTVISDQDIEKLQSRLEAKAYENQLEAPSSAQIAAYYEKNKRKLVEPTRWDVTTLMTATKQPALAAKRALLTGASWEQAAAHYAVSRVPEQHVDQARGDLLDLLDRAVDARPGVVLGPVQTSAGWYVLEVTAKRPPFQLTLAQSTRPIRDMILTNARRRFHYEYSGRFDARYRAKTICLGSIKPPACKNGPRGESRPAVDLYEAIHQPVLPPTLRPSAD
jgi:foldase protein PrsA